MLPLFMMQHMNLRAHHKLFCAKGGKTMARRAPCRFSAKRAQRSARRSLSILSMVSAMRAATLRRQATESMLRTSRGLVM